jgi:hypothetical protein
MRAERETFYGVGAAATREEADPSERSGGLPFLVGDKVVPLTCEHQGVREGSGRVKN